MAMDLTIRRVRHLGRPARLHGRLGRGDRRDDAARSSNRSTRRRSSPARQLGLAFQLTNFLRDVGEDLDRGRVYLPQEDLERFGADPAARVDDAWRELMRFEIDRCRALYELGGPRASRCCRPRPPGACQSGPYPLQRDTRAHRGTRLRRLHRPGEGVGLAEARHRRIHRNHAFISLVAFVGWVSGWLLASRMPCLPHRRYGGSTRRLSVVIPARDEEHSLPRLLQSLATQSRTVDEVIVVDDESSDGTADSARRAGATVVSTEGPPEGWTGKTWACERGRQQATGELLVFLDADTWLAADALDRIDETHARQAAAGLLSIQPFHVTKRTHEQLSAGCNVVAVLASGIGLRPHSNTTVAFGPCLAVTSEALANVGGFASVRRDVVEDIALANRFRARRLPVRAVLGRGAVSFRMYPTGLRSLVEGWTKNLAVGSSRAPLVSTVGAVMWVTGARGRGAGSRRTVTWCRRCVARLLDTIRVDPPSAGPVPPMDVVAVPDHAVRFRWPLFGLAGQQTQPAARAVARPSRSGSDDVGALHRPTTVGDCNSQRAVVGRRARRHGLFRAPDAALAAPG